MRKTKKSMDVSPNIRISFHSAVEGKGRNASDAVIKKYACQVVFMENEGIYWVYDSGAIKLCEILNTRPYYNSRNEAGVQIKKEDLLEFVAPALAKRMICFAINTSELIVVKYVKRKPAEIEPEPQPGTSDKYAGQGCFVSLFTDNNERIEVYLAEKEISKPQAITLNDGTIKIIRVPVTEINGVKILTEKAELYKAISGKSEGDIFSCSRESYRIASIRRGRLNLNEV